MIKIQNSIATREALPPFLAGLSHESLSDLSWTDPQLGVQDAAWWPEEDQSPALGEYQRYGQETLTPDSARKVVVVTREVLDWGDEEIAADLNARKDAKRAEINAARLAVNFISFTHQGKVFACDTLSRSDIDGTNGFVALYGALPPGWPGGWKAMDNTYLVISTVAEWKAFYSSMFAAGSANFAHSQSLKSQLDAAATAEEVAAIQW